MKDPTRFLREVLLLVIAAALYFFHVRSLEEQWADPQRRRQIVFTSVGLGLLVLTGVLLLFVFARQALALNWKGLRDLALAILVEIGCIVGIVSLLRPSPDPQTDYLD